MQTFSAYLEEAKKLYQITRQTSNKSLGRLARRNDSLGAQARQELKKRVQQVKAERFDNKHDAATALKKIMAGKRSLDHVTAKKLITTLEINPKSMLAKSLRHTASTKNAAYDAAVKAHKKRTAAFEKEVAAHEQRQKDVRDEVARRLGAIKKDRTVTIAPNVDNPSPKVSLVRSILTHLKWSN